MPPSLAIPDIPAPIKKTSQSFLFFQKGGRNRESDRIKKMRAACDLQVEEEGVDEVGDEGPRDGKWSHHFLHVQEGRDTGHGIYNEGKEREKQRERNRGREKEEKKEKKKGRDKGRVAKGDVDMSVHGMECDFLHFFLYERREET